MPDARVSRRSAAPALLLALAGISTARSPAQGIQGEGPLGNDAFLPASETAGKELLAGDEALSKRGADDAERRTAAFEAWFRALSGTETADCVPRGDRASESVDTAVRRRLRTAGDEVSSAWRARFDALAASALVAAGSDEHALARVARGFPLTRAAARAAIALADLAHESGDPLGARAWLDRAGADADPKDAPLAAAIARRRRSAVPPPTDEDRGAPWRSAGGLSLESQVGFEDSVPARSGVCPGIAFLADGRVCVQGAERLHFVAADGRVRTLELSEITRSHGWSWLPPFAERGERWPLLPAGDGTRIVVVAGRAATTHGNALLSIDASPMHSEPVLAWGYSDAGFAAEDGSTVPNGEILGPGLWEFEPGPLVVDGAVVVQAHQWTSGDGEPPSVDERAVRSWCLALDLESGRPRWKRLLAAGASDKGRLEGPRGFARPAQPMARLGGQLLAGTGIGAAARVDLCDGRVVATWKYRRAPEGSARWSLSPPAPGQVIVWAPPDSDRMYFLRNDPEGFDGVPGPLGTREIGEDVALIGAGASDVVLLSRAGGTTTLARLDVSTGGRAASVELPAAERFPPCGIASASRAVVAGDRAAYLFDLERGAYLLDVQRLPGREESPDGSMAARGERIYLAGERRLWILKVR